MKVAVCGASGGIGQPLSLLLKQSPLVTQLNLFDIVNTPGVAADLSHINTNAKVKAFNGNEQIEVSIIICMILYRPCTNQVGVCRRLLEMWTSS